MLLGRFVSVSCLLFERAARRNIIAAILVGRLERWMGPSGGKLQTGSTHVMTDLELGAPTGPPPPLLVTITISPDCAFADVTIAATAAAAAAAADSNHVARVVRFVR